VSTLAGLKGTFGSADGTETDARFYNPSGITTDGINLYVADTSNHLIRQIVIATGSVTTLAGSGSQGSDDHPTGTSADFYNPQGITTDGVNLYVADTNNHTIRKIVIASTTVTTIAGFGEAPGTADNATGTNARFNGPAGITIVGTVLYVADKNNHEIRKIELSGSYPVTTFAGGDATPGFTDSTGLAAEFNQPAGISTNGIDLFVADQVNSAIRRIVISTAVVTTIAGDGTASFVDNTTGDSARFNAPTGIVVNDKTLFVSDTQNYRIRKIVISE
jgi:hypothetical protein